MKYLFVLSLFFAITSCGSMSLKVTSEPPEADVILHTKNGAEKIGKTPLEITNTQLRNVQDGFTIEVTKNEHFQQKVLLEKRSLSSTGEVNVKLQPMPKVETKINDPDVKATIEYIARQVASIQSSLLKQEYSQAEVLTKNLLNAYPRFSVGWNLLGNNYYLQGKYSDSISYYQKALELDPDNQETRSVINKIQRTPSSREP